MYGFNAGPGYEVYGVPNVPTWEDCGYLCEREERCQVWIWVTERPTHSWQVKNP
jgi:hypothetical protein